MTRKALIAAAAAAFGLGLGAAQADVYIYKEVPADSTTTYYYTPVPADAATTYYSTAPTGTSITHHGGSVDDKDTADRIAGKMQADGGFDGASIDIGVYNGEVQLRGNVRDDLQSQRAATIAASFTGHNKVMNDLRVSG